MRIAVFDYKVVPTNPIGGCHRRMLEGLAREQEFVVFAPQFENPCPDRIRYVRVPVPTRPLVLLFVAFHLLAPLYYVFHRLWSRRPFDFRQSVESNTLLGNVVYSQFCHRRYLREHWPHVRPKGVRRILRYLDHKLHALAEPFVYRKARQIVVASRGLARELQSEYPYTVGKIAVVPNPVDLERMRRPAEFDAASVRRNCGFAENDTVLVFTALGHFERKGLPLILDALAAERVPTLKLLVVGGAGDLIEAYTRKARELGIADRVHFAGMQRDVRPYLWSADAFVFPSIYEVFSLSVLEALAAGVPMIVPSINGVEEFARDGENVILIRRDAQGVREGIGRLLAMDATARRAMSESARRSAEQYRVERFHDGWREVYRREAAAAPSGSTSPAPSVGPSVWKQTGA